MRAALTLILCPLIGGACSSASGPQKSAPSAAAEKEIPVSSKPSCKPPFNAEALAGKAAEALGPDGLLAMILPAAPRGWPAPTGVEYWFYRAQPLPTGRVTAKIEGPIARVAFAPLDAAAQVERFAHAESSWTESRTHPSTADKAALAAAEQALVELAAGCTSLDAARPTLSAGYVAWARREPGLAQEFEKRAGAFAAALGIAGSAAR